MAKFTTEQATAAAAIQQLINDWAYDLDFHNNANVGDLITDDISYNVAGSVKTGREAVQKFYGDRLKQLEASGEPLPVMRHLNSNFRTSFTSADEAVVTFHLAFWTTEIKGYNPADVIAVADVVMTCRRGSDGDWKISKFDSGQALKRMG